jgi:hypothetical protein
MKTRKSTVPTAKKPAAKKAAAPARADLVGTEVVVLGTSKARGGRYQVLAPMTPTRHVSIAKLDSAVRLVLEPQ